MIKWRIGYLGALPSENAEKIFFVVKAIFDPYIFCGLISAVVASLFWVATMSKFEISHAYPFVVAGLVVLTAGFGVLLFGESLSLQKAGGILLICIGVIVMSHSA